MGEERERYSARCFPATKKKASHASGESRETRRKESEGGYVYVLTKLPRLAATSNPNSTCALAIQVNLCACAYLSIYGAWHSIHERTQCILAWVNV